MRDLLSIFQLHMSTVSYYVFFLRETESKHVSLGRLVVCLEGSCVLGRVCGLERP